MTDRFMREHNYSLDDARRFASANGLKLAKSKETGRFEFVRTISANYEPATWEELKEAIDERGLAISGSGGHLRVVRVSEGVL